MNIDWNTVIGAGGSMAVIVSLVVWQSKTAMRRQDSITKDAQAATKLATDRLFNHLEEERQLAREERREIRQTIQLLSSSVSENSASVRELAKAVSGSCKHPGRD